MMNLNLLPFHSSLTQYRQQAEELFEAWRAGDPDAIEIIRTKHPLFRDERIPWLVKNVSDAAVQSARLELADAELTVARQYEFRDWSALAEYAEAVGQDDSPVYRFESAVEAVIHGDEAGLRASLESDPELVRARSSRILPFDPPQHRATLLHYVAANGVEGYRQLTPANAVEIAEMLLKAGAEVDALADMYGGECTTMSMLVSSTPPAEAGVQVTLVDVLLDFGAAIEGRGSSRCVSPLMTALAFGFLGAAEALVKRGAQVRNIAPAAGLGRLADVRRMLADASSQDRHRALALAAQHGHTAVVQLLLDAGESPNRYNPEGNHAHSTPLHQAVASGHENVVRLLVERGAKLDIKDTIYQGTALGWAEHCRRPEIADFLRLHGAGVSE